MISVGKSLFITKFESEKLSKARLLSRGKTGHVGDGGVQAHSCGPLFPWRVEILGVNGKARLVDEKGRVLVQVSEPTIREAHGVLLSIGAVLKALPAHR